MTNKYTAVITSAEKLEDERLRWLWPGRFPLQSLCVLAGNPGVGKSFFSLDLAARLSRGIAAPDGAPMNGGESLIINVEDSASSVQKNRLRDLNADMSKVHIFGKLEKAGLETDFNFADGLEPVKGFANAHPHLRLIVIDPVSACLGQIDGHNNSSLRGLLAPWGQLARDYDLTVLTVTHFNKHMDSSALNRISGSIGLIGACRSGWGLVENPKVDGECLLLPIKNNLSQATPGLAFRIETNEIPSSENTYNKETLREVSRLNWDPTPRFEEIDAVLSTVNGRAKPLPALEKAMAFLRQELEGKERKAVEMAKLAERKGISSSTLRRAQKALHVEKRKEGNTQGAHWLWSLPAPGDLNAFDEKPGKA